MTAGTELDKELMGLRPGRRPAQPKPIELTQAEELELAKAKAGRVEWVGPGVAAYILAWDFKGGAQEASTPWRRCRPRASGGQEQQARGTLSLVIGR